MWMFICMLDHVRSTSQGSRCQAFQGPGPRQNCPGGMGEKECYSGCWWREIHCHKRNLICLSCYKVLFHILHFHVTTLPPRLGKLMRAEAIDKVLALCDEFTPGETPEYFFDRNPDNFPAILNMYRTGKLHTTERGCALVLQRDLQYWGVDDMSMEVGYCLRLELI